MARIFLCSACPARPDLQSGRGWFSVCNALSTECVLLLISLIDRNFLCNLARYKCWTIKTLRGPPRLQIGASSQSTPTISMIIIRKGSI